MRNSRTLKIAAKEMPGLGAECGGPSHHYLNARYPSPQISAEHGPHTLLPSQRGLVVPVRIALAMLPSSLPKPGALNE